MSASTIHQRLYSHIESGALSIKSMAVLARTLELRELALCPGITKAEESRPKNRGRKWDGDSAITERYTSSGKDTVDLVDFGSQRLEAEEIRDDSD